MSTFLEATEFLKKLPNDINEEYYFRLIEKIDVSILCNKNQFLL